MDKLKNKIKDTYIAGETTLRFVARICNTDHHKVKRTLEEAGILIVKGKKEPPTQQHRDNISKACIGRRGWNTGKKMPKASLYKNMQAHIRFDISLDWLLKFEDIEKLKLLNRCITNRSNRFGVSKSWYMQYIEHFYYDKNFNIIYFRWLESGKELYLRPSIDHILPKAKGGDNGIGNLQFLSWFENRCKNDMTQTEWDKLKLNIGRYLL